MEDKDIEIPATFGKSTLTDEDLRLLHGWQLLSDDMRALLLEFVWAMAEDRDR